METFKGLSMMAMAPIIFSFYILLALWLVVYAVALCIVFPTDILMDWLRSKGFLEGPRH